MPVRALDLLLQPLPPLDGSARGHYYKVDVSSDSTALAPTPKVVTYFLPNTFQNCFGSPALARALAQLEPIEAISTERGHYLLHEGDIERASAVYLLHPVNIVLGEGLLPLLHIPVAGFHCFGQYPVGASRPDILYVVNRTPVMIVEYKHT